MTNCPNGEGVAPCSLTDADCVATNGPGSTAVHGNCAGGPCDYCTASPVYETAFGAAAIGVPAIIAGGAAQLIFKVGLAKSVAIGAATALLIWLGVKGFERLVGGTM